MTCRVALVVPGLVEDGGVPAMARFVHGVLQDHPGFSPELVSLATSASDDASVRLRAPSTWFGRPSVEAGVWLDLAFRHVGAVASELEFQRYRPRPELTRVLREFDLVHVFCGFMAWGNVARDVASPVVLHPATLVRLERAAAIRAGSGVRGAWQRAMTAVAAHLEETALQRCDAVFTINSRMAEYVAARIGRDRVALITPGVDTDRFLPDPQARERHLIATGRWSDPRKNVGMLLRAYALSRRRVPDPPPLLLVGSPPTPHDLAAAESRGELEGVVVVGKVDDARLVELLQASYLLVLSSDEEGFGIVLTEAMACGRPVVATRCGGAEMSVVEGKTGFLVPVADAGAMADRLARLLSDDALRQEMGVSAVEHVRRALSRRVMGEHLLQQYEALLSGRPGSPPAARLATGAAAQHPNAGDES